MKKNKLNSNNPKYKKNEKDIIKYRKVLKKEGKGWKMYFCYEI